MVELTELHKHFLNEHLQSGGVAVDFTMGNGNDTLYLSKRVGKDGRVYAFDIQEEALLSTEKLLLENDAPKNYKLILASHHLVKDYVKEPINAGIFNLGYLPRSGKKAVTTLCKTTLPAIQSALEILSPDGAVIVAIYPGHEEGKREGEMVREYLKTLNKYRFCPSEFHILNSEASPYFFLIEKSKRHFDD